MNSFSCTFSLIDWPLSSTRYRNQTANVVGADPSTNLEFLGAALDDTDLDLEYPIGDFCKVGADHVRTFYKRIEDHSWPGNEGSTVASVCRSSGATVALVAVYTPTPRRAPECPSP